MKRNYPVGIQNFEKIRSGNYCYIDKTELIYKLVKSGQYYFLSRPRRFGKSLLISTLEAYFQGKKELFEGLAMDTLETEWTEYPILHLDLNAQKYDTPESLYSILNGRVYTVFLMTLYARGKRCTRLVPARLLYPCAFRE